MTFLRREIDAIVEAGKKHGRWFNDKEACDLLEAARATPPEEVVEFTQEMDEAGIRAYEESPQGVTWLGSNTAENMYRAMHSARPKVLEANGAEPSVIDSAKDNKLNKYSTFPVAPTSSKVSSEAPVDGACAPSKECDHVWITMVCQFDTHETSADWCVKCGKGDNFARHKPRTESTPHDLPIKYQRNVGGVQTISYCTRADERRKVRLHDNFSSPNLCYSCGMNRRNSDRRSPKGAA